MNDSGCVLGYEDPFDYVNGNYYKIRPTYAPVPEDWTDKQKRDNFQDILVQESLITGSIKVKIHYKYMSESERDFLGKVAWHLDINHYIRVIELTKEELKIVEKVFVLDKEGESIISELKNKIQDEYK